MKKTILLDLSSSAVFRNLFFFPGSFFDKFKESMLRDGDLMMVLLVPCHLESKYSGFFKKNLSGLEGRFVMEGVGIPSKKNFIQKVFYFFYSYLIFTGTTKIMATMGTRPDEPPAGGRWYLAFIKVAIAQTLGRIDFIKLKAVPFLFLKIFGERPFASCFDKYQPDLVFVTHLYGWFDALLMAEAARRKIKTVAMAAGWDHLDKYYLPFHADILIAQSKQVKEAAVKFQKYHIDKVETVGYPHFDFISRKDYLMSRQDLLKRLNFPPDSKFILYVSGSAYCPDEPEVIEKIIDWAKKGEFGHDLRVVVRPYSGGRSKDREFDERKFKNFEKNPLISFYKNEFWGDLEKSVYFMNILYHADIVISVYSTMVLEAAVLDRPLMAVAFDGNQKRPFYRSIRRFEQFEHFKDVLKTGALRTAYDFDQLFGYIKDYLDNPELDGEKREILRRKVCGLLDGTASEKINRLVLEKLGRN